MKNKFSLGLMFILLGLAATSLTSCEKKGCTDANATNYDSKADEDDGSCQYNVSNLMLHFHPYFNGGSFAYGSELPLSSGRKINLSIARFYISQIKLTSATGETELVGVYQQFKGDQMDYSLGEVTPGTYTGITFTIGLDSAINHADPSLQPDESVLSSSSETFDHWTWNAGYIFAKFEGLVDSSAAISGTVDAPFAYHVGAVPNAREVTIDHAFTVEQGLDKMVTLNIDLAKFFDGVDLTSQFSIHSSISPMAALVIDNLAASITTH